MTQPTYASGLLFTKAHRLVRARIYVVLDSYGLNPSYWAILGAAVSAPDGIRLATVAKLMDVKAPLVTMLSSHLIKEGLINRIPHHSDKRAKLLVATHKGKKLASQIETELVAEISALMNGVNVRDARSFQSTLEAIIANAENLQV